ncbi:MAG TPA: TPM domain-containing protein [Ignavibacteriaceae bacterium]|nr:TPM domain-containing protein [Ignavibacteriaceae bacterium]
MPKKLIYSYLNDDELLRISSKIRDVEKTTAGELVVSIKEKRKLFEKSKSLQTLAEHEFINAEIAKTAGSTGVLIFLVLTSKEFYILADKKINEKVDQAVWNNIATEMGNHFIDGNFCKGILMGIEECGKILSAHFPILPNDVNELSNNIRLKK